MNTFKGEGIRIAWTNGTGAAVSSGDVVVIGDMIGIAVADIANGSAGALEIQREHSLAALSTGVWSQGEELFWDATNERLTAFAGGNTPAGKAAADKANAATTATVWVNAGGSVAPELLDRTWEDVAVDKTLDAQDVGKVINVTVDAKTITLPATAAGLVYVVRNGGADAAVAVTINPNANDKIMGADLAGVDNKDRINTKATACRGDYIVLRADGSAGWYVEAERGTWAAEA